MSKMSGGFERREIMFWKRHWREADRIWGYGKPFGAIKMKRRFGLLVKMGDLNKAGQKRPKVLELGCGTGAYTELLAKAGVELVATDLVSEFVQETRARLRRLKAEAHKAYRVRRADARRLPFRSSSFDAVVGNSVLHHVAPLEECLAEIYRVLIPGGRIAFCEPNMLNPHIFLQKNIPVLKRLAGDSPGETAFVRWRLSDQLRKGGFTEVGVEPFDFNYPFLPTAVVKIIGPIGRAAERLPVVREIAGSVAISAKKPEVQR